MRYDSIIVGTGPAGLEAAINLKIRNKSFLLFGTKDLSSKLHKAPRIENYLGFPSITGVELMERFQEHLKQQEIQITEERVSAIYHMGDYFAVSSADNVYESHTLILAPGVYTSSQFRGEEEFLGRGVGYCATCDAPLYKGKTVGIVGTSPHAETEANFVAELVEKVYYIPVGPAPTLLNDKVEVVQGKVKEIQGDKTAHTLVLDSGEVKADGFFILREAIAPATLLPGLESQGAHIKVDTDMSTNLPGCFAAGDCTGTPYQYSRAAGQGLTAAHSAVRFLTKLSQKG